MAETKLTSEQQNALLTYLTAEYSGGLIRKWFLEREWPILSDATLSYYRKKWATRIEEARRERRTTATTTGLALKEERVKRLAEHADELEAIKWVADEKTGRLWNEKAWRETLDDIAKEMGHRRQGIDLATQELEAFLDRAKHKLPAEQYAALLALAVETGES